MWCIAKIEKATLIVAAHMSRGEKRNVAILDFVLVAGGRGKVGQQVAGLCVDAGTIVFKSAARIGEIAKLRRSYSRRICLWTKCERISRKKTLNRICGELPVIRFSAHQFVVPVFAGSKIPSRVRTEKMVVGVRIGVGRFE